MAVDTEEITTPAPPPATDSKPAKAEKTIFTGQYVAGPDGRITVSLSFPDKALEIPNWSPIGGLMALAEQAGLKGYGPDNAPQCVVGIERAKVKNSDTGEMVPNPRAGQPNGNYSIVLHTDETLTEARKRGRTGTPEVVKKTSAVVSSLIKSVMEQEGGMALVESLVAAQERGEMSLSDVLAKIQEAKQ